MTSLKTKCLDLEFENPFVLASAPPTASIESIDKAFSMGWAGAVLKTITPDSLDMYDLSPRYAVQKSSKQITGFLNIELLSHKSVKYWCDGIRFLKQKHPTKMVIASIMAPVEEKEWKDLVITLNDTPVDAYELNFSCPHGMPEQGIGMAIGTSSDISSMITRWVKDVASCPVFVKLSPNVTNIATIGKAVEEAGADGLAAINTVQGLMGVDLDSLTPIPNVDGCSTYGGLSGRLVKPIGLRCVSQLRKVTALPIWGMGGISDWKDTVEYIAVGADIVQICTEVMINGYGIIEDLKSGLLQYLESKSFDSISSIHNKAASKIKAHEDLNRDHKLCPRIDRSKCIVCGKCQKICSESEFGAISIKDRSILLDSSRCEGCSLCSLVCPREAISMQLR